MKKCRSCQKEIDIKAKKCPYCQEKQGNWALRHPIWTGIIAVIVFFIVIGAAGGEESTSRQSETSTPAADVAEEDNAQETQATAETMEATGPSEVIETSEETVSQKNAIRKARSYLDYAGFSRSGLIKQLEFEKFSKDDATYAVDNIVVDWNEQAAKKAASYQDYSGFSRDGMITQLEFEGFTNQQANYGATEVGL